MFLFFAKVDRMFNILLIKEFVYIITTVLR